MRWLPALGIAGAMGAVACGAPSLIPEGTPEALPPRAPDSFHVVFETTKGNFTVAAHRDWAPLGVDRFHDLVGRRYYDDVVIYRVVEGYVAQFGLHGEPAVANAWRDQGLPDEPVVAANLRGRVSFARGGPRSRTAQLFINLGNNSPRLDTLVVAGVTGYPPIGEVVDGIDVVDSFEARHSDAPARFQDSALVHGNGFFERAFPGLDRILRAEIVQEWH